MTSADRSSDEVRKQEIVGVYDRASLTYDRVGIRTASYFGARLVKSLDIFPGAQVLDVACGRGALLFPAALKVGPAGRVVGIDLAPGMVEATAAEIIERRLAQAEVRLMDGDAPNFPDSSFDFILCGYALHFLNYPRALRHFKRLLKPGGDLGVVGPYIPTNHQENLARWAWLFQLTREVFPPDFVPPAAWTAPNRLSTPEAMTSALQNAGFENIRISREEKMMFFVDENDWWDWEWSQASRFWLEGMSPAGLAHFKQAAFEKLGQIKTPEGIPMLWGAQYATAKPFLGGPRR